MFGLKRGTVKLTQHNPQWRAEFTKEKKRLTKILGKHFLAVEHVGSTAIPGLKAKPIMDLLVAVKSIDDFDNYTKLLEKLDYAFMRDNRKDQEHVLYVKGPEAKRTHYLKLCQLDSDFWQEHILFKEYLMSHPEKLKEYEELKVKLAKKYKDDRYKYTKKKEDFIQKVLKLAQK